MSRGTAAAPVPANPTLERLREASQSCTACPLYQRATRTVFGAGSTAKAMLVGEQPGHEEDLSGLPFVGPAGRLLDRALEAARIDRTRVYVTNVVKHFKWRPQGKRRIHEKPNASEIAACRPWLDAEIAVIRPRVLVCLGATAAHALLGRAFRLTEHRGELVPSPLAPHVMATIHPSALLRVPDPDARHAEMERFVADLTRIAPLLSR